MKKAIMFIAIPLLCVYFFTGCTTYPDYGRVEVGDKNVRVSVEFSDNDRNLIRNYYKKKDKKKHKKMPPGLAKKNKLPPGLQKQLVRKGKLPPGLEGRYLPHDLDQRLSRLPRGYERQKIGDDIVLIETMTRLIVDIIYGGRY